MKRLLMLCALLASFSALAGVELQRPLNPGLLKYAERVQAVRGVLVAVESAMNSAGPGMVRGLVFAQCNEENAYFEQGSKTIRMCFEYLHMLEDRCNDLHS